MNGKAGTKLKNNLDRREVKSAMITYNTRRYRTSLSQTIIAGDTPLQMMQG
jgi:hypothetical protein